MNGADRLVGVREIADRLGVKPSWVYGKTAAHEIPYVKVGHYVRFDVHTVLAWLDEQSAAREGVKS